MAANQQRDRNGGGGGSLFRSVDTVSVTLLLCRHAQLLISLPLPIRLPILLLLKRPPMFPLALPPTPPTMLPLKLPLSLTRTSH